ncbi:MAG: hypothetical protein KDE50_23300, partial [Caldilineaceae bacterium]|nr:hypothetical protein [Caldilineaceae bacterium]
MGEAGKGISTLSYYNLALATILQNLGPICRADVLLLQPCLIQRASENTAYVRIEIYSPLLIIASNS